MSMATKYAMMKRGGMCAHGGEPGNCKMCMAEGGFVEEEKDSGYGAMPMDSETMEGDLTDDMIDRIMAKRMMSEGGEVANDDSPIADEKSAQFDDLVKDDELESGYTGENSGDEIGDEQEDKDRDDMIERIMKQRAMKASKMPRPA